MKEILQTKVFKILNICCLCICSLRSCIVHVENVAQDFVATGIETEEAEGQEEQLQELEAVEPVEESVPEANSPTSDPQQGKHRKHLTQCHILIIKF